MNMRYKNLGESIPHDERAEINQKILSLIDLPEAGEITKEDIYNAYTGDGGLHGLDRKDFANYYEFSEAKKSVEHGQFFTPPETCERVVSLLKPRNTETVCDPTCGKGDFFNFLNPANCFGTDIDGKAVKVARYLYPEAHIDNTSIVGYAVDPVDYIVGNPPFNLRWNIKNYGYIYSQDYFFRKSAELLKPGGFAAVVVPESFLKDAFSNKSSIEGINEDYSFVGQVLLSDDTFKAIGVLKFPTKILVLQRRSEHLLHVPYDNVYSTDEEIITRIEELQIDRRSMAVKLRGEMLEKYSSDFVYKLNKYLYEIKTHKTLENYVANSLLYVEKFHNQKCPETMDYSEWEKTEKITESRVLKYLKRVLAKQNLPKPVDEVKVIKTSYHIKLKAYSPKESRKLNSPTNQRVKSVSINDLVTGSSRLEDLGVPVPKSFYKLINKKIRRYEIQRCQFENMERSEEIDRELRKFVFRNGGGKRSKFNEKQVEDLGLILQKDHAILNWQMGCGKTIGGFYWTTEINTRYNFIVSTSLSINNTWKKFLKQHDVPFVIITDHKDFAKIEAGTYLLFSFYYLKKFKRRLKKFIKENNNNIGLLFDESDEITDHGSTSTKTVLSLFRRAKRKLLTTGTTTRNNIAELYSQFELCFNNSYNFIDQCPVEYREKRDKDTKEVKVVPENNPNYGRPFKARGGNAQFKRCFNPSKTTVFGVQKHNQKVYNSEAITELIGSTIITRKFKDIAGDKYAVRSETVLQTENEKLIYRKIIHEFSGMVGFFYNSTGNSKKDAMLNIVRQIQLLIKATSIPQNFPNYRGGVPNKAVKILSLLEENPNEKITIGCTGLETVDFYVDYIQQNFPDRPIFEVTGGSSVVRRGGITGDFESTENGVMVCTQQSLKSSLNIPSCNLVIMESLQWNIPRMEQFYFRFIRYDSKEKTEVIFLNYENTIEVNLLALLMAKERINDFVKTKEYKEESAVFEEFGIDADILTQLITKEKDANGKTVISW